MIVKELNLLFQVPASAGRVQGQRRPEMETTQGRQKLATQSINCGPWSESMASPGAAATVLQFLPWVFHMLRGGRRHTSAK